MLKNIFNSRRASALVAFGATAFLLLSTNWALATPPVLPGGGGNAPSKVPTGATAYKLLCSVPSPYSSTYNKDGTVASSTIKVKSMSAMIFYVPNTSGTSSIFDYPFTSPSYYYFAVRVTFDSSSWTTLQSNANAGVGIQWVNVTHQTPLAMGTTTYVDYFDGSGPGSAYTLFKTNHPKDPATVGQLWFPLSQAQSGLSNPSSDTSGFTYNDANSAYYIFHVATGTSGGLLNSLPFNIVPYTSFTTGSYGAGAWLFTNPTADGYLSSILVSTAFTDYQW